ncbi:unnamed protein product, partial [Meganyctiphanes norvegica]
KANCTDHSTCDDSGREKAATCVCDAKHWTYRGVCVADCSNINCGLLKSCLNGNGAVPYACYSEIGWGCIRDGAKCKVHREIDFSLAKVDASTCDTYYGPVKYAFMSEENKHYHSDIGVPQTIWHGFAIPVSLVKYSFQSRSERHTIEDGPTKYTFFGSNSNNCSDDSSWTILVKDESGLPFTSENTPKTEMIPGNNSFTCYGFLVLAVGGRSY